MDVLAAAPAAPLVPAAGITAAMILLLFVWVVLWGTLQGYDYTLGALIRKFATSVGRIPFGVGGALQSALEKVDHAVQDAIAAGLSATDHRIAQLWDGLKWLWDETVDAMVDLGASTHTAIQNIINADIPAQVDGRVGGLVKDVAKLRADLRAQAQTLARKLEAVAADLAGDLERTFGIARKGIDAIRTDVIPRVDARAGAAAARVGALGQYVYGKLTHRVGALERALAGGILGAIAIHAFTRVWPWWKCTNVRKASRLLCRAPVGLLDDLLLGGVTALVVSDVCALARIIRAGAVAALPILRGIVAVEGAALQCTAFRPASGPAVRSNGLPASEGRITLRAR